DRRRGHARGRGQSAAGRRERRAGGIGHPPARADVFHHAAGGSRTLDGGTRHRRDRRRARTGEAEGRRRPGCVRACALHQGASQAEGRGRNDMTPTSLEDQRRLVTTLGLPIVETHISYVLLDGKHAYKVKKAVNLEFLDFTTLDARRFYCHEELT